MDYSTVFFIILSILHTIHGKEEEQHYACDSPIYCHGPLLRSVQMSMLFNDSKTFVDMAMKQSPEAILQAFEYLQRVHTGDTAQFKVLREFVEQYFAPPGTELEEHVPEDWVERPEELSKIQDGSLRKWAYQLNDLWKHLSRKVKADVADNPDRYSLLYVPHPFIVPGDRFRELYYWDSYWVVRGLLLSGMTQSARNIISNLLHLVSIYGHVPNGGRVYYIKRSQPPLLIHMMHVYYEHTGDLDYVRENVHLLEKEYNFWIKNRSVSVEDSTGERHELARYAITLSTPRPEGYTEDLHVAESFDEAERSRVYGDLAAAAESGWDFSSRWFTEKTRLSSIHTANILPVDLNVFLQRNEFMMAQFYEKLGMAQKSSSFRKAAERRWLAVDALMWQEQGNNKAAAMGTWCDYNMAATGGSKMAAGKLQCNFYPSNVFPLLMLGDPPEYWEKRQRKMMASLQKSGVLSYPGGVPSSLVSSGQQWDFPNAWAPLIDLLIEAMERAGNGTAARDLAQTWISTNYRVWRETGHMMEKYDVESTGSAGGGGEYSIQTGFGWSNAVVLILLNKYPDDLHAPSLYHSGLSPSITICLLVIAFLISLVLMGWFSYQRNKLRLRRKLPAPLSSAGAAIQGAFSISEHSNAVYHPVSEPSVHSAASSPGPTNHNNHSAVTYR